MTIRSLKIFVEVAESGKISDTARKLYITQASVSQCISEIEKEYDSYYQKNSIIEARKITEIDYFRHEEYVDDVELLHEGAKEKEYLWARIEDCSKKNLLFVCTLLETSKKNKNYKEGTLVLAKLEQRKKEIVFVTDGIVDKVQK